LDVEREGQKYLEEWHSACTQLAQAGLQLFHKINILAFFR